MSNNALPVRQQFRFSHTITAHGIGTQHDSRVSFRVTQVYYDKARLAIIGVITVADENFPPIAGRSDYWPSGNIADFGNIFLRQLKQHIIFRSEEHTSDLQSR